MSLYGQNNVYLFIILWVSESKYNNERIIKCVNYNSNLSQLRANKWTTTKEFNQLVKEHTVLFSKLGIEILKKLLP